LPEKQQQLVLPFYVLADVSYSMTQKTSDGGTQLDALNKIVHVVKDALEIHPLLSDKVRFALVDFSDEARTQIPLCDLLKIDRSAIPVLTARGGTSFAAAFRAMRQQIDADVRQLKADGDKVHRPAVFFLTDGEPTDQETEWEQAFAELTDSSFKSRPNMIPFGVADAKKALLDRLVYPPGKMKAYITRDGVDPGEAIRSMAEKLIGSVIASASSISSEGESGGFVPPDEEENSIWL
jgi:uncharacterized protein YegL